MSLFVMNVSISTGSTSKRWLENPSQRRNSCVSVAPAELVLRQAIATATIVVFNSHRKREVLSRDALYEKDMTVLAAMAENMHM